MIRLVPEDNTDRQYSLQTIRSGLERTDCASTKLDFLATLAVASTWSTK